VRGVATAKEDEGVELPGWATSGSWLGSGADAPRFWDFQLATSRPHFHGGNDSTTATGTFMTYWKLCECHLTRATYSVLCNMSCCVLHRYHTPLIGPVIALDFYLIIRSALVLASLISASSFESVHITMLCKPFALYSAAGAYLERIARVLYLNVSSELCGNITTQPCAMGNDSIYRLL
jgi:hypothetical protein